MKHVLLLGAGLVTRPLVNYLLDQPNIELTIASRTLSKAEKLIAGHPRGEAKALNVKEPGGLRALIPQADLVISLLPYIYHVQVAELCVAYGKHLVTTSYVKEAMSDLDQAAKKAGVILLNEIGLDPGLDHMSAMKVIHQVQKAGGTITSFRSYCGGLPAPEANDNPFGYKFSWSPRGVVLAGRNPARWLENGQEIAVPGEELFAHHWPKPVAELELEAYPNRDAFPYIDLYGLEGIETMFRGTLRYPGWCQTWYHLAQLGWIDERQRDDLAGLSFAQLLARLIGKPDTQTLKADLAAHLDLPADSDVIARMAWLGLLSDMPIAEKNSLLDVLAAQLMEKLQYRPGERDMIVLHHEFVAEYPDRKEAITSTLIDYGEPGGDTSMARTVGLPAAIATRLILAGEITVTGVHIPVIPEIYEPVLAELEDMGIGFEETVEVIED